MSATTSVRPQDPAAGPVLRLTQAAFHPVAEPVSLTVEAGEVLGLAGLEGHGQELFLCGLCGVVKPVHGQVEVIAGDRAVPVKNPVSAARAGIVYLPRDRKTQGILPALSVRENLSIASLNRVSRFGIVSHRRERRNYAAAKAQLKIVAASSELPITALSGGNQQKVLMARALQLSPRLLVLNDPTRGLDVGAKQDLYSVFRDLSSSHGMAIAILSTELRELVDLCDRVLVFHRGSPVKMCRGDELTEDTLLSAMFGVAEYEEGNQPR